MGGWCFLIGKAVVADITVDSVRSSMKAVFGFGNMSSASCPFAASYPHPAAAIVKLQPVGASGVSGTIIFQLLSNALSVSGFVSGFKPSSSHGMHVHTFGDVSDVVGASRTGMHFLFPGQLHGLVSNPNRHTGDLGNIVADQNGVSAFNILVPLDMSPQLALTLLAANGSAIGRSVIVHANIDDGVTQPTGKSGARVAQGVIGYARSASSSAVIALMKPSFACACTLSDAASGVTYGAFCPASACISPSPSVAPASSAADALSPGAITAVVVGSVAFIVITAPVYVKFFRNRNALQTAQTQKLIQ